MFGLDVVCAHVLDQRMLRPIKTRPVNERWNRFRHRPSLTRRVLMGCPLVIVFASFMAANGLADVVHLSPESGTGPTAKIPGTVLDYTGETIRVRTSSGLERDYPSKRVVKIDSNWVAEQTAAEKALAAGDARQALVQFAQASRKEPRVWVRRRILAEMVWCYRALGESENAGNTFLLLLSSDPTTPHFDAIPLAWMPSESVTSARARVWLARNNSPGAMLLGASHLLSGEGREVALEALRTLSTNDDPRIAALATAQIWRSEVFRANDAQIERWRIAIESMPKALRAGPYFLLGRALARAQQYEQAALALLHVPILYPRAQELSAASLVAAADNLRQLGLNDQAVRLYEEVLRTGASSRQQTEARMKLEKLKSDSGNK